MTRYVRIGTWAKLAGIKRESVYKKLKRGSIKTSDICQHPLIDIEMYPPNKMKHEHIPLPERELPDWCYG